MTVLQPYNRLLGRISEATAREEPAADHLFIEPPTGGYPKIAIQTTIEVDGLTLNVTFNDTSISDAVAILRRRGRTMPSAAQPRIHRPRQPRRTRSERPISPEVVWCDLGIDDAPASSRGASIIELAQALLREGRATNWSAALEAARQQTPE